MKTWVLAITLFGATGAEPWRSVKVPELSEVSCLEMLGRVLQGNPKGKGLAFCYDAALGERGMEAMPQGMFEGR
jgi:hypothetical protein